MIFSSPLENESYRTWKQQPRTICGRGSQTGVQGPEASSDLSQGCSSLFPQSFLVLLSQTPWNQSMEEELESAGRNVAATFSFFFHKPISKGSTKEEPERAKVMEPSIMVVFLLAFSGASFADPLG